MRMAFYAYDIVLNQKLVAKLHKNLSDNANFELMKKDPMSLIACKYFADEFNSRILLKSVDQEEIPILINFVDSSIYEVQRHYNKCIKYYFVENYIDGDYYKYNNNAGLTSSSQDSEFNLISQAFSHFIWQYSQGQLLAVDIQGADLGVLTDPQIHTKNKSRLYGQGDLGYEGILKFFHTHYCNQYCEKLDLLHPILEKQVSENFEFFSDLYGLDQKEIKQGNIDKKEETNLKEQKETQIQGQIQNKQKKKRGFALKKEYEKQKQEEEEEESLKKNKKKKRNQINKNLIFLLEFNVVCAKSAFSQTNNYSKQSKQN